MSERLADLLASPGGGASLRGGIRTRARGPARRLSGIPLAQAIGNHGAETGLPAPGSQRRGCAVEGRPGACPGNASTGVWVEDKGLSLAVHYRLAPTRIAAKRSGDPDGGTQTSRASGFSEASGW